MKNLFLAFLLTITTLAVVAQKRIIGGVPVTPPDYEWMAGLSYSSTPSVNDHFCGGSLIDAEWVVTAAHCVFGENPSNLYVFFKAYYLDNPLPGYISVQVEEIYIHPDYDQFSDDHDIALIKLSQPVNNIQPVLVPQPNQTNLIAAGKLHKTMGWGATENSFGSDTLLEVTLPIVDFDICNGPNSYAGELTENMICAGLFGTGGVDACQGDSGGPLFTIDNGNSYVTGVVSWGNGCAEPDFPGVYANLINYTNWIESYTGQLPTAALEKTIVKPLQFEQRQGGITVKSLQPISPIQQIELISMNGSTQALFQGNTTAYHINTNTLAKGIYVLNIKTNEGIFTKRFAN